MQGHATDYRFPTVDNRQKFPNLRIPKDDCFFLQFLIQGTCYCRPAGLEFCPDTDLGFLASSSS